MFAAPVHQYYVQLFTPRLVIGLLAQATGIAVVEEPIVVEQQVGHRFDDKPVMEVDLVEANYTQHSRLK